MLFFLQTGQFQLLDPSGLVTPEAMLLYQVNIAGDMALALDVSSNYKAISFGDSGGMLFGFGQVATLIVFTLIVSNSVGFLC